MTLSEHKEEVDKLQNIEDELVDLIAETNNEELQQKFLNWQDQRNKCNEGFVKYLKNIDSNG